MEDGREVLPEINRVREEIGDRFCVGLAVLEELFCGFLYRLEAARIVVKFGVGRLCRSEGYDASMRSG